MDKKGRPPVNIEILQVEDGLYRARCEELALSADGATIQEAEGALLRLLDERLYQRGELDAPPAVHAERDARMEPEDREE
jgi:hypothetical protein